MGSVGGRIIHAPFVKRRDPGRAAQATAAVQCALALSTVISVPALRVLPRKKSRPPMLLSAAADTEQAQVFHSLLAERRAELCDRLDEQAIRLARYEHSRDSAGARRKRGRIKEIGAVIRDIDRMMHGLRVQLLGVEHERSWV